MACDNNRATDVEQIDTLRSRWESFDNTGDETLIVDFLADDVVLLPPGEDPIVGKPAVVEVLEAFPADAFDVEHTGVKLLLSGELAVDYVSVAGTKLDREGDVAEEVRLNAIDVYRRDTDANWKVSISMWNDPT